MSHSDLYILNKLSVTHVASFSNGWGSAPRLWEHLSNKYFGSEKFVWNSQHLQKVWDLHTDLRLSEAERTVLLMTFDKAYIPLEHLNLVGDACIEVGRKCYKEGQSENHWPHIGETLKDLASLKFNKYARGIVLSATSVNDCWVNKESKEWIKNAWSIFD